MLRARGLVGAVRAVARAFPRIEHSDERLLVKSKNPSRPQFQPGQPFSLFVTNTQVAIGPHMLAPAPPGPATWPRKQRAPSEPTVP